mmetsp:Transcript_41397/g.130289  ORF Transcript_41397/g.130289 Transcript_41397/m.130289 type:complete len:246 (-) Transcript_41397:1473-2210(-)
MEGSLDEMGQKLLVQAPHVDAGLVEPALVDEEDFDHPLELLPEDSELVEAVLHYPLPPDLDKGGRPLLALLLLFDQPLEDLDPLFQRDHVGELAEDDERLAVLSGGVDAKRVHLETFLQPYLQRTKFSSRVPVIELMEEHGRGLPLLLPDVPGRLSRGHSLSGSSRGGDVVRSPEPTVYVLSDQERHLDQLVQREGNLLLVELSVVSDHEAVQVALAEQEGYIPHYPGLCSLIDVSLQQVRASQP